MTSSRLGYPVVGAAVTGAAVGTTFSSTSATATLSLSLLSPPTTEFITFPIFPADLALFKCNFSLTPSQKLVFFTTTPPSLLPSPDAGATQAAVLRGLRSAYLSSSSLPPPPLGTAGAATCRTPLKAYPSTPPPAATVSSLSNPSSNPRNPAGGAAETRSFMDPSTKRLWPWPVDDMLVPMRGEAGHCDDVDFVDVVEAGWCWRGGRMWRVLFWRWRRWRKEVDDCGGAGSAEGILVV